MPGQFEILGQTWDPSRQVMRVSVAGDVTITSEFAIQDRVAEEIARQLHDLVSVVVKATVTEVMIEAIGDRVRDKVVTELRRRFPGEEDAAKPEPTPDPRGAEPVNAANWPAGVSQPEEP